jgi:hypothetical protein
MWTLKSLVFGHCFQNSKWFGEQRVGTVSKKSGKGKHTTRHVSLLPIVDGGFLADTPGFNQPSLMKLTKQGLAETFPEVCSLDALLLQVLYLIPTYLHGQLYSMKVTL